MSGREVPPASSDKLPAAGAPEQSVYFAGPMMVAAKPGKHKGMALTVLILGCCAIIPVLGIVCAVAAIVLGASALIRGTSRKDLAIGGIVAALLLAPIGMLGVSIMAPSLSGVRGQAKAVTCSANLKAIGMSVHMYLEENRWKFPPNLAALEKETPQPPAIMRCSASGEPYFYHPPQQAINQGTTIIACDLHPVHPKGRNWLMADGTAHDDGEEAFRTLLARAENQEFAAALRAAGGDQ